MNIIDTHAHLDHIENLDEALTNADRVGVTGIVTMSINTESCRTNLEIKRTKEKPKIYLAFGMHPSDADRGRLDECVELIHEYSDELTAVGEIGLDFWYKWVRKDKEKKDEQRVIFRTLLEVARECNLPAVIHTRGTWRESFETAKEVGIERAEFHWYSGPRDVLKNILDRGYYVSTSPSVAYSLESREAMAYAPIEQTMIETDSPVYYRTAAYRQDKSCEDGFQAEPKDVFQTLKAYCELKKIKEEDAITILNRNAGEFFKID